MSLVIADPPATSSPPAVTSGSPAAASSPPADTSGAPAAASSPPAVTGASPADAGGAHPKPHRDKAIDLVRFGCLVVVVILHSMMSGAELGPDGSVIPTVALSTTTGFTIASWFFQVMPLFFIIGGYAVLNGWRRTQAGGGTWADFLRTRMRRLIVPVTVLITVAGIGLSLASEIGTPAQLLAEASTRIGQPLWFLAVYVGLTSLVPLAARLHARAPRLTIAALAGAVIAVDGAVRLTGVAGLGYLNFLFVWPLIQQCGFFFADSLSRPVRTWMNWTVIVLALGSLGGFVGLGFYSPNMLVNLNPPTGALVLLGLAQMSALRLAHAWLSALVEGGSASSSAVRKTRAGMWDRAITWGNVYGIQVYLWHMPIVITLIGGLGFVASLLSGLPLGAEASVSRFVLPDIQSAWWWGSRLPWLLTVMGLSALLATVVAKIPFLSEAYLARAGQVIVREARALARGFRGSAAPDAVVGSSETGAETHSEGIASRRSSADSSVGPAMVAVGSAVSGIAIALLVGIAPLIWTFVSVLLLMASLILAAGLRAPGSQHANRAGVDQAHQSNQPEADQAHQSNQPEADQAHQINQPADSAHSTNRASCSVTVPQPS